MDVEAETTRSSSEKPKMIDVLVIGAGPAGVLAAPRAADLGARTALLTRTEFGGMAANDGPVPVRTPGPRSPAASRSSTAGSIRHRRERANAGLSPAACART